MPRTKERKDTECAQALADLQTLLDVRLEQQGGYPADIDVIDSKYIVIADVDHDHAPDLTILSVDKFLNLWRRAKEAYKRGGGDNGDMDLSQHLWELGYPGECRYED